MRRPDGRGSVKTVKRTFDLLVSGAALAVLSPVFVLAAIAVWLDSGRPILFAHERVGSGFRRFAVLKFRTMRNGVPGPMITMEGDNRVTSVGRLLRLTKLDELPQLWNVLRGEMSLVGPRPEVPEIVEHFRDRYEMVLSVRPGITDYASLRFRNEESALTGAPDLMDVYYSKILPAKLDLAEEYVRSHSLTVDVAILLRTAVSVICGSRVAPKARVHSQAQTVASEMSLQVEPASSAVCHCKAQRR
jgi:lipopolysaccharide/colanic/teichoic acid biosynthesis glycosyltransferase